MSTAAMPTMEAIAADEVLAQAFTWLCERRQNYGANNDVWRVRQRWATLKPHLQAALLAGTYQLGAVERDHIQEAGQETTREVWGRQTRWCSKPRRSC